MTSNKANDKQKASCDGLFTGGRAENVREEEFSAPWRGLSAMSHRGPVKPPAKTEVLI